MNKKSVPHLKKVIRVFEDAAARGRHLHPKPKKFIKMRACIDGFHKKGETLVTVIECKPHIFKSKSKGFYGQGKGENFTTGERYQISVTAVLIGSKPKPKTAKKSRKVKA